MFLQIAGEFFGDGQRAAAGLSAVPPDWNWLLTKDAQCSTPMFVIITSAVFQGKLCPGRAGFKGAWDDLIDSN
jgi:hypothetical protein